MIEGVEAKDIDKAVVYLISLDKNDIDKKYFRSLEDTISTILMNNKFNDQTERKLDELLNFLRIKIKEKNIDYKFEEKSK